MCEHETAKRYQRIKDITSASNIMFSVNDDQFVLRGVGGLSLLEAFTSLSNVEAFLDGYNAGLKIGMEAQTRNTTTS